MSAEPTILVTGAGGFIGGRIVEALHLSGRARPRAGIRRWTSAPRLARFPVQIALCDILQDRHLNAALEGVDAVVHCAHGDRRVTVDGTRSVLEAARRAALRRVVHLSTVEVYSAQEGDVDESSSADNTQGEYAATKTEAERLCLEYAGQGLPVVVLRPTIVYGPFGKLWTVRMAQRLIHRAYSAADFEDGGICNLVYVDDVVRAVFSALWRDGVSGEAFNVNGPERLTWAGYLTALNRALDLPPLPSGGRAPAPLKSALVEPVRSAAKMALQRFQPVVMGVYKRYESARLAMKWAESLLRNTPTPAERELYRRPVFYPTDKAERLLGYSPGFPLARGVERSVQWLRHHRLLPE